MNPLSSTFMKKRSSISSIATWTLPRAAMLLLPLLAIFLCSVRVAVSGTDPFAGLSGELRIVGSDLGLAAVREAAGKIMAAHPGITITCIMTGAGTGNRWVRLHQADLCLYDRDPGDTPHLGIPLTYVPYGVDPVAVVVNPLNTVGPLSVSQLRQIFGNRSKSWNEVGGGAYPVLPMFLEASEREEGKPDTWPGNFSVSSQPAMLFTLARNKESVGYVSLRSLDASLKPVAVDGVMPDRGAFLSGRYRVYRIMYASLEEGRSQLAKAFMEYMTGPEGQILLNATGYVPLAEKPIWESVLPVAFPNRLAEGH
jgi:phosphate transport system substrate-binding protein